jgi:hypothetical protein
MRQSWAHPLNVITATVLVVVRHVGGLEQSVVKITKKRIPRRTGQSLSNHRVSPPVPLNQQILITTRMTMTPILIHLITEDHTTIAIARQTFKAVPPILPRNHLRQKTTFRQAQTLVSINITKQTIGLLFLSAIIGRIIEAKNEKGEA